MIAHDDGATAHVDKSTLPVAGSAPAQLIRLERLEAEPQDAAERFAFALWNAGRKDEAVEFLERQIEMRRVSGGAPSPDIVPDFIIDAHVVPAGSAGGSASATVLPPPVPKRPFILGGAILALAVAAFAWGGIDRIASITGLTGSDEPAPERATVLALAPEAARPAAEETATPLAAAPTQVTAAPAQATLTVSAAAPADTTASTADENTATPAVAATSEPSPAADAPAEPALAAATSTPATDATTTQQPASEATEQPIVATEAPAPAEEPVAPQQAAVAAPSDTGATTEALTDGEAPAEAGGPLVLASTEPTDTPPGTAVTSTGLARLVRTPPADAAPASDAAAAETPDSAPTDESPATVAASDAPLLDHTSTPDEMADLDASDAPPPEPPVEPATASGSGVATSVAAGAATAATVAALAPDAAEAAPEARLPRPRPTTAPRIVASAQPAPKTRVADARVIDEPPPLPGESDTYAPDQGDAYAPPPGKGERLTILGRVPSPVVIYRGHDRYVVLGRTSSAAAIRAEHQRRFRESWRERARNYWRHYPYDPWDEERDGY